MVEKMMVGGGELSHLDNQQTDLNCMHIQFDNQQKQMGKPTSDELKQQEVRSGRFFAP